MSPETAHLDPDDHGGSDNVAYSLPVDPIAVARGLVEAAEGRDVAAGYELITCYDIKRTAVSDPNLITIDSSALAIESAFMELSSAIDALSDEAPLERPQEFDVLIENALELYGADESDEEVDAWADALAEDVADAKD